MTKTMSIYLLHVEDTIGDLADRMDQLDRTICMENLHQLYVLGVCQEMQLNYRHVVLVQPSKFSATSWMVKPLIYTSWAVCLLPKFLLQATACYQGLD